MAHGDLVQALTRGITILEMLSEAKDGLRLKEISEALGVKASTAHNLLRTLVAKNMVGKKGKSIYVLGDGIIALAQDFKAPELITLAETEIRKMANLFKNSTITYAEPVGAEICYKLRMSPDQRGVMQYPESQTFHPYVNASGLAVLAFGSAETLEYVYERHPFFEFAARVWGRPLELDTYIKKIRETGLSVCPFERERSFRVACPVYDGNGVLRGILGVSTPAKYFDDSFTEASITDVLRDCAQNIKSLI